MPIGATSAPVLDILSTGIDRIGRQRIETIRAIGEAMFAV
jgi:hypothetical protein